MRAFLLAGLALAALAAAQPVQAQIPLPTARALALDDSASRGGLQARVDTTWLGASLLTPIPEAEAPTDGLEHGEPELRAFTIDTTLPCLEYECPGNPRHKRFWRGFGELMIVQIIPNAFSRIRDKEWAKFSLQSWADNIKYPWQWDNNAFLNNQFSHPYHGNLYFNSARTNGYNFWQSVPWAFGGSLMWELFGEVWAPAPNDLLNTSLGGIALGEMLYRMSSLTIRNEATGTERVFREIGATLLNPVRGFNRAVDGTMFKQHKTPDEYRPSRIFAALDLGYRRFTTTEDITDESALNTGYLNASLVYGNSQEDLLKSPFSYFRANLLVAFNPGEGARRLSELNVRGSLGGKELGGGSGKHRLGAFMTYEYISSPIIEFGAQGFTGGFTNTWKGDRGPTWHLDLTGIFNPIAALKSDYFLSEEGRDYDYGIGLGARSEFRAIWKQATASVNANYRFIPVISGFPAQHQLANVMVDGRYYFWNGKLGAGASYMNLWRWSAYTDRADFNKKSGEVRVFVSTALPRWGND